MLNEINIYQDKTMTITGAGAHSHVKLFRKEMLSMLGLTTKNRFFVYEINKSILRAAQTTKEGAMEYMTNDRVLVELVGG